MGDIYVRADIAKNRLYMKLSGYFTDEEAAQTAAKLQEEMRKLSPGFDIINDLSELKPLTPKGSEEIARGHHVIQQMGVGRIVRIVSQEVITKMQWDRKSKEVGIAAQMVTSMAEAERLLDQKPKK